LVLAEPIPPRLKASCFFRAATIAPSDSLLSQNATSAPWQMSRSARDRPAAARPASRWSKYARFASSGTKLVPSHPSAISPVSRSMAGESVAR
jgi:hypothetical protein